MLYTRCQMPGNVTCVRLHHVRVMVVIITPARMLLGFPMVLVQLAAEAAPPLCCLSHNEGTVLQLGCSPRDSEAIGVASVHDTDEQKDLI